METLNSYATYDSLFVGVKLESYIGDFNFSEVQLFCYFACLLSLYEKNPVSNWGYRFIKNKIGVPLSEDIQTSLNSLLKTREMDCCNGYFRMTPNGKNKIKLLSELPIFRERSKYLENACDSLLVLPIGSIRNSITCEPMIKSASQADVRALTGETEGAVELLYEQFEILKTALNVENIDLFVPAVTWLKYLMNFQPEEKYA